MTSRRRDAAAEGLQSAFDEQIPSLGLPAESSCDADVRAIGVAFAAASKAVSVQIAEPSAAAPSGAASPMGDDASQNGAITAVLQGYESLSPADFAANWRNYATDPHMGVGTSWVGTVNDDAVQYWLKSDALQRALAAYPCYTPRKVTLQDVQIVYIGSARAAATYRVTEQHTNGATSAGNAAAVLMNTADQGWRIVVVSKGGRGEV